MLNTAKKTAKMAIGLLARHATDVVVSPGSRNVPLIMAIEASPALNRHVVVDERSAAFVALGISLAQDCRPVGLVCTSGTAPLNYAPAIAEAYYRHVPLIAITADRPEEWIDQDDGQTIRQPGIFANYIKGTYDIPVETDPHSLWLAARRLNDAFARAMDEPRGPVHINLRLDEPLGESVDEPECTAPLRVIETARTRHEAVSLDGLDRLVNDNVLIVCGFNVDAELAKPLLELASRPNVVMVHEAQSNLHDCEGFIPNVAATLASLPADAEAPELIITIGGSIVSRKLKEYVRALPHATHWSVGRREGSADVFRKLERNFDMSEKTVLEAFNTYLSDRESVADGRFKTQWAEASKKGLQKAEEFAGNCAWSDLSAIRSIIRSIPAGWNLQLSNGTPVRYAQLFDYHALGRIHCNRGVSGIDGSTSTAIGFAAASDRPTVLLTGDMSMQYDIGALGITFVPPTFKIIVINNGGGGIFRTIPSTRRMEGFDRYFTEPMHLPLERLADAYGYRYFRADSDAALLDAIEAMYGIDDRPCILETITSSIVSQSVLNEFFNS